MGFILLFSYDEGLAQITCTNPTACTSAQSDLAKFSCKVYENDNYQGETFPNLRVGEYVRVYLNPGTYTWQASANDGNCGGTTIKLELQREGWGAYVFLNSSCTGGTGATINTTDGSASGIYISLVVHPCMADWYLLGTTRNSGVNSNCLNCTGVINSWNNSSTYSCTAPSSPSFSAGATTLCAGGSSTYTATAAVGTTPFSITYSILSGGASINSSTGVVSSVTSNFTVRATISNSCGSTTVDRAVTVIPNAVRNAPTGPQCSGTQLNFSATSIAGSTYSWTVNPPAGLSATPTSGSNNTFSTTITNSTTSNIFGASPYILVVHTLNGVGCTTTFNPTIQSPASAPTLNTVTDPN